MKNREELYDMLVGLVAFAALVFVIVACHGCTNGSGSTSVSAEPPASRDAHTVVFLGDSITARWSTLGAGIAPTWTAVNAGVSGQTSEQIAARLIPDAVNTSAGVLVIMGGTNDILGSPVADPSYIESAALTAREYGMRVLVCTIPETSKGQGDSLQRVAEYNDALATWALDNAVEIVNYYPVLNDADLVDGIHPSAAGYALMLPVLLGALNND